MKVLIIGGTGLISTAITRYLQEREVEVIHYNRGQTDTQLRITPPTIIGDRKDFTAFEAQMADAGPFDCVIDMIGFLPDELESAVRAFRGQTGHFIFCSTVDVYTKPAYCHPITEDAERKPKHSFPYAFAKAQCERIVEKAHQRGDFPATIIRPAYTYGEGRGILQTFRGGMYYLHRIRQGKPIIVHGDGSSFWTACHRDDVGHAFANAIGNPNTFGKSYHVTGEEWMTWDQYHQRVAEAMNAPEPTLVHITTDLLYQVLAIQAEWLKENFQFNNIFSNQAAIDDLDFRFSISWQEGVRRIVAWLDERGRIDGSDEPAFYELLLSSGQKLGKDMEKTFMHLDRSL